MSPRRFVSVFFLVALPPAYAGGQDPLHVVKVVQFIQWGGVFLSFFVLVGAGILLRLITNMAERLGALFRSSRPTIQKYESWGRFLVHIVTLVVCFTLSVKLDATLLTVVGGTLAFAIGFALRDLMAAFLARLTILFDKPFQVGDRVNFAGQ